MILHTDAWPVRIPYNTPAEWLLAVEATSIRLGGVSLYLDEKHEVMLYNGKAGKFVVPQKEGLPKLY